MELIQDKILLESQDLNPLKDNKKKRKTVSKENQKPKKSNTFKTKQGLYRTLKNLDMESCWMNSCLQLVLTAIEHRIN